MGKARLGAILAAVVAFVLCLVFADRTPYRTPGRILSMGGTPSIDIGAPDELQHANRVRMVARGEGWGNLKTVEERGANYEVHQPPLYYGVAAMWMRLTGGVGSEHGMRLRAVNAVIVALTVFAIFLLTRAVGGSEMAGLIAAWGAALLPMHLALGGAVSNDPLLFLLSTAALIPMATAVREGWTLRLALFAGLWTGLALLTKTNGLALFVPFALAGLLAAKRPTVPMVLAGAGVAIGLALPWLLRNQSLYGDPLGLKVFDEIFGDQANAKTLTAGLGAKGYWVDMVGWWTLRSCVGVFGYMDIWLTSNGRPNGGSSALYLPGLLVPIVGLIAWAASVRKTEAPDRKAQWLLVAFFVVTFLLFVRFNGTYFQAQGRYLFPALGAIGALVGIGLASLGGRRPALPLGVVVAVYGLTTLFALSVLPDAFAQRATPGMITEDPVPAGGDAATSGGVR